MRGFHVEDWLGRKTSFQDEERCGNVKVNEIQIHHIL